MIETEEVGDGFKDEPDDLIRSLSKPPLFDPVNVSISSRDSYCIEVVLRCLATEGDGLGPHKANDGGILSADAAAAFKGELTRFQAGVTMDIFCLDAWYSSKEGSLETPATYIVRGLCRRCCLPELVLRSMLVREGVILPLVGLSQSSSVSVRAKHKAERLLGYLRAPRKEGSSSRP